MTSKYDSEIYNDYIKSNNTCSFEDYLFENYNLLEFYFDQSQIWADELGEVICDIYRSGLLKGSKFESKIKSIHTALDV